MIHACYHTGDTPLKRSRSEITLDEITGFTQGFERGYDRGFGKGYEVAVTSIRCNADDVNKNIDELDKEDVCVHVFQVDEVDEDDVLDNRNVMMALVNAELDKAHDGKLELDRCIIVPAGEEMIIHSYEFLYSLSDKVETFHKYRDIHELNERASVALLDMILMEQLIYFNERGVMDVALYSDVDISEDDVSVSADYVMVALQKGKRGHIQAMIASDGYLLSLAHSCSERIVFILHTLDMDDVFKNSTSLCIRYAIPRKMKEVRYCASNGNEWQFGVLKKEGDRWMNYLSDIFILRHEMGMFDVNTAAEVFQITLRWISPDNISSIANLTKYYVPS